MDKRFWVWLTSVPSLVSDSGVTNEEQLLLENKVKTVQGKVLINDGTPGGTTIAYQNITTYPDGSMSIFQENLTTGELIGSKGGKGKVVGTIPDGKVVANMAGRNVIFENGKQNTISAGSFKKIEIPKTNEVVEVPTEVITKNNTKKVPENTLNIILDKVKSKITGKPLTQVQLERIGVDVKVRNSGIKIDGTFEAGNKIDNLENNKGHNFPTFDIVIDENGKKTAISTKSLDLTSKSYTSKEYKNQMYYNIKGYIDDIDNFKKAGKGKDVLTKKMISKNVLEISINEYELTKQQIDNIKRSMDYAKEKKVELKFIIEK